MTKDARLLGFRILATLEEAGEDEVCGVLNTIIEPTGGIDEVILYGAAIRKLLKDALVEVEVPVDKPWRRDTLSLAEGLDFTRTLSDRLVFADGRWGYPMTEPRTFSRPNLVLTQHGFAQARRLLAEHGYEWWRAHRRR